MRRARLPYPYRPEVPIVESLLARLSGELNWDQVLSTAKPWVKAVREKPASFWALESLLREYPLSTAEGLALMRLAEALLRIPDIETSITLTADQLGRASFEGGESEHHGLLAGLSISAIAFSKKLLPESETLQTNLFKRLGARTVVAATVRAIQLLGRQFVLGTSIEEALGEAATQRRNRSALRFSFDMLGEGARTERDAVRYLASYRHALKAIGAGPRVLDPLDGDGLSIKLSALYARYEEAQYARVMSELVPRVTQLVEMAAQANINLTIDAEESERLELSLAVFEALADVVEHTAPRWRGLGLAIQAYQTRALAAIDEVESIARDRNLFFVVRLVKGAYWDGEIKRAQELGVPGYPVFTHKHHTDVSYLACARRLMEHHERIYPQFATHNAGTIAAILQMAQSRGNFEMQRLHGMGETVYREMLATAPHLPLRVYAPVGEHRDLLAYLVRRLLENGANSSFVHQLADESNSIEHLLRSPLRAATETRLSLPRDLYSATRPNSRGADISVISEWVPIAEAVRNTRLTPIAEASCQDVAAAMERLQGGFVAWKTRTVTERAAILRRAADLLEQRLPFYCGLLVREGRKTVGDCVAEVREAVDFYRYYAEQAEQRLKPMPLPGPTGESNELRLHGRGVFICISPWNFPLAIFAGQVAAALISGNAVAAKPAEQTPVVAQAFVNLLYESGVPADTLQLLHGPGTSVGKALVSNPATAGVCFTGSTKVAKLIQRALATKDGPIVPLIAETGGLNAMIVDSTALPEQVVDAVVLSAFRSAGQRCSALRLLCVHESVADKVLEMLSGAMETLVIGNPDDLATDVGPIIDAQAHRSLKREVDRLEREAKRIGCTPMADVYASTHIAPVAYEIAAVESLQREIFGPVLHVVRWREDIDALMVRINRLGYGLTLGIQTRIDSRARRIAELARAGNVYVNRNIIGAVVGVQPFGGEGLSGTGPKAGGPHYLYRFCTEQTLTINTAAGGGNATLLAEL